MIGKLLAGDVIEAVGKVADGLFTSDEERLTHAEVMERLRQRPHLAQVAVNRTEASHRSTWVAGWRPAIGWTCAAGLGYHFILHPLLAWAVSIGDASISLPPDIDVGPLLTLVMSMLGLGGLRTFEKAKGLTR